MKNFIINFILYFYTNYIQYDWLGIKPIGKTILYPLWFIESILLWCISPIFIIEYIWVNSKYYIDIKKMNDFIINEKINTL